MKYFCIIGLVLILSAKIYGQDSHLNYRLTIDTILLKDVTISSTIPLNDSQIEKFYRTNYFSTIDNLAGHLDGVSLIKRGAYAMEPQLNGFSAGQLNITIDGMKMFGACTDKMDPVTSYLEPVNLKSITVEHGTNGALHGNNIGGSIDLALKEPLSEGTRPLSTSVTLGYETVSNSRNILASIGYFQKKWAWGINGVYRKNDNYRAGGGEIINFSQFEKYNLHSVLKFNADSISVFRADLLWDLARNVGYPALPMDVSRARAALAALEYQRNREKYKLRGKVYYNSIYHIMDDSHRDSLFFLKNNTEEKGDPVFMRMDMPGWSNTFGSFLQTEIELNSRNRLTIKADNYMNSALAEMTMHMHYPGSPPELPMYLQTWPDLMRNVTGLFINNSTILSRKLLFNINGRIDFNTDKFRSQVGSEQFSVFNLKLAPKYFKFTSGFNIIAKYRILKTVNLTLHTGLSERIPTITERYGFYLYNAYDGYDYIGNPFLRTEKSISSRFSLTYFNHNLKVNLSQSVNFLRDYIMGITDLVIPPMNFYTNGLRIYQNIPGASIYSTDLQIMYKPAGGFSFFLLSKYTRGEMSSGEPLPLIPPLKNFISVSYEYRRWSFQADNETALRQKRINSEYGELQSPSFTIFNIKSGFHFMMNASMMDFSAVLTNLFDTNYYEHLDWGQMPRPGRSFSLLIKYTF